MLFFEYSLTHHHNLTLRQAITPELFMEDFEAELDELRETVDELECRVVFFEYRLKLYHTFTLEKHMACLKRDLLGHW